MTADTNNFSFLTKSASRMMDCSGYIKLNISCHSNLYVFTQYTAFFNREAKTRDFMCPDPFKVNSNMELKVTYMCFECGMTGKRCEDCHYLCISDVPDDSNYASIINPVFQINAFVTPLPSGLSLLVQNDFTSCDLAL